jgi:predicted membrane GTPase involved in stress response
MLYFFLTVKTPKDHGKTTLVDQLLRACSSSSDQQSEERLLDCGELEKLRGITISVSFLQKIFSVICLFPLLFLIVQMEQRVR